ncbi:MAG: acyl-CoA thioesterase [Planctomycetes bacterium]|nr:acyl-CoA thioesterase [Planctomycetota bacterium]
MAYVSSYEVEVRSYELDVYNHVNNAVYLNWLEHGRSKLLQDKGFDYLSIMDAWGVQFMTVHTGIDYHKALKLGDRALVTTQVARVGNTSITVAHAITRVGDSEPAAKAEVVVVYTDATTGRPTPVPKEFVRLYA